MSVFEALVLGIVQGFTEFLPISSTAHLRIVPHWLGWSDPGAEFSAVIQLGTLLSVLLYFREDVVIGGDRMNTSFRPTCYRDMHIGSNSSG